MSKIIIQKLDKILQDLENNNAKKIGFVFSTTSKISKEKLIFLPIRKTDYGVFGAITIYNLTIAKQIAKFLDGKIDFLFVDAEKNLKKVPNLVQTISKTVKKTPVFSFKNNDLTTNTADALVSSLLQNNIHKKISIVGLGNIGTKLSLKLVERGFEVFVASTNLQRTRKVSKAINLIKSRNCKSKIHSTNVNNVSKNSNLLVCFSSKSDIITEQIVQKMKNNSIIIDGGIGTISKKGLDEAKNKKIALYRLDIRPGFIAEVTLIFENQKFIQNILGKNVIDNVTIVSGGFYGKCGDIVVNSITNPTQIFGIADGFGGLIRNNLTKTMKENQKKIKKILK